ncbi:hypothetical protein [Microcoleus sp. bin38.metabat.b11b12b14.051]|uniref:hypothetical protein n=1 Tax=Microcoleus sp. bin38.metabat.b11b12b14.051 TaxID=2742709 RepID=UPI0025CCEA51|nr:hypothetical protein [Microcoleus sp. bin38.metabat.b11b12b14.051]
MRSTFIVLAFGCIKLRSRAIAPVTEELGKSPVLRLTALIYSCTVKIYRIYTHKAV